MMAFCPAVHLCCKEFGPAKIPRKYNKHEFKVANQMPFILQISGQTARECLKNSEKTALAKMTIRWMRIQWVGHHWPQLPYSQRSTQNASVSMQRWRPCIVKRC
jgi:hypothetical protein